MLVLTRKMDQKIKIGDNITITVIRVKGQAVRLGIEAPKEVPVVRSELNRFEHLQPGSVGAAERICEGHEGACDAHEGNDQNGCSGREDESRGHAPAEMFAGISAPTTKPSQAPCGPLSSAVRRAAKTEAAPASACIASANTASAGTVSASTATAGYRSPAGAAPLVRRAQRMGPSALRCLAGRW